MNKDEAAEVMVIIRKVFTASTITLEQEKRMLVLLRRAVSKDAALEAVDLMYNEGVRYPDGRDLRLAIERVNQQHELARPRLDQPGPWISFADWYALQDPRMQARVRRVFPSLNIEADV